MTNATKTLALFFAATLVFALATTWGGGTASSAAFQDKLLAVDTSAVQAIQIERPNGPSVRLERSSGNWSVQSSNASTAYPASAQTVRQTLNTLPSLEVGAVATRRPDKHPQYGVDSTGTAVTLLGAADEPLGRLIVGRTRVRQSQPEGSSPNPVQRRRRGTPVTYVRTPDRPDVYSIEQSLRSVTSRDVEDWRDKQIWGLTRADIQRIDFRYPADSSFAMQRVTMSDTMAASGAWVSAGDTLSQTEVSSMLRVLSSPQADGFAESTGPDDFGEALYEVRLRLADGARRSIRLRPAPDAQRYLAVADSLPYVVELQAPTWDQSVLRGRSALLDSG
ncbi:DUF4340 domain-containing protein [Salinibacter grassmerensis]|uniref:DUF4340 domain-containing protein n=1 Tax=Salinibacter grassmerensis TaxID=3040353 RepID=UPI0021E931C1|nr:DUF4340 domain-containing protein [Salinibacter grassmerensis]